MSTAFSFALATTTPCFVTPQLPPRSPETHLSPFDQEAVSKTNSGATSDANRLYISALEPAGPASSLPPTHLSVSPRRLSHACIPVASALLSTWCTRLGLRSVALSIRRMDRPDR